MQGVCIRKYGSNFYVGMHGLGSKSSQNGRLYLSYGSSSEKTTAKSAKTLTDKNPTIDKNAPRVLLPYSEAEKRKLENFDFVILLSSSSCITQKP